MKLSTHKSREIKIQIATLNRELTHLKQRCKYMSCWCKLCGAGYGRHFSDCPCDRLTFIVVNLRKALE